MTRLVSVLLLCFLPSAAAAELPPPDPGDVWISFDEVGNRLCTVAEPGVLDHRLWVLAQQLEGDLAGYEFGLEFDLDAEVVVTSTEVLQPGATVIQTDTNFLVGLSACVSGAGTVPLVRIEYGVFGLPEQEAAICVGQGFPSSFAAEPGYLTCDERLVPFTLHPEANPPRRAGCVSLFVGSAPPGYDLQTCSFAAVGAATESWGMVKTGYR